MSLERAVKTWLDPFAKTHPIKLPENNATDPAIVFSVDVDQSPRPLSGSIQTRIAHIDVDLYGTRYVAIKDLAKQIEDAANGLGRTEDWNGISIHSGRCRGVTDLPFEADTKKFHVVVEVTLFIKEA